MNPATWWHPFGSQSFAGLSGTQEGAIKASFLNPVKLTPYWQKIMEDSKEKVTSPEKKEDNAAEDAADDNILQDQDDDTLRDSIIEKHGLNPDDDRDVILIDELVADKKVDRRTLATAIKQKRSQRKGRLEAEQKLADRGEEKKTPKETKEVKEDTSVEKEVSKQLQAKAIEDLDVNDDIKTEIRDYVALKDCSVKKALDSKFIKSLVEEEKKAQKEDEASASNKGHRAGKTQIDYSKVTEPTKEFDLSTDEGVKAYEGWKKWAQGQTPTE